MVAMFLFLLAAILPICFEFPPMLEGIIYLAVGMALLVKGADLFVDGASSIAKALKIPSLIIGLTLVSMGTSAPEASVSINSAVNGLSDMSIGNVVGSNIFNTFFILGISSVIVPLVIGDDVKKYDIPIMVGLYATMFLLCFVITPLTLDLVESIIMLVLFVAYMVFLIIRAKKEKAQTAELVNEEESKPLPVWKALLFAALGLAGIVLGGDLVVDNASLLATQLGMSESLVALTIVAVGTSLPELVTSVVASIKKENDIAVGNVIGSNIFNIIFILGLSSTIHPLTLGMDALFDMGAMMVSGVAILLISLFGKNVKKWQGALMLFAYVAYLAFIIIRNYAV